MICALLKKPLFTVAGTGGLGDWSAADLSTTIVALALKAKEDRQLQEVNKKWNNQQTKNSDYSIYL